ncbi:hypothetical protein MAR_010600 [Mya arenaria]|uniref:DUF7869 domain-containing protein n=1 Tax=Mya arenaria TaxID=6604 RepID=A0ABY7E211_MYAAR|nr:hypothetical protein MAR_010600 [Mya arenaria]
MTHRDTGWDIVEGTDEDGELSRLDTRIEDFLSGSMCDENDESMQAPDEDMSTDDCRCKTTCMSLFDSDKIQDHILSVREMEKSEKELYVMGSLQRFAHEKTKGGKRKRIRYRYVYDGRNLCNSINAYVRMYNVSGQNKNRYVLAYLSWRIQMGLHEEILLLMQIPGHTRCLVDSGFANIKKLFRRCDVDSLAQLAEVVDKSSKSNVPVPYKKTDGSENWAYLQLDFLPVRGIQKYHSFQFCKADSSAVYVKRTSGEPETRVQLMKRAAVLPQGMPNTVTPAVLTAERRRYLRMHVRQYVRPACSDSTCPEE